jgi:iduronate 2-sulfatase
MKFFRALAAFLGIGVLSAFSLTAAQERLNVLLIAADDLRPDLGCYGSIVKSPNIDRLAARGLRFDRAYCQYPVCNPSRTSLLTGLRPNTTKVLDNGTHFRKTLPEVVTLPQLFRQNGYFAAGLGKIYHRGLTMEDLRPEMDDAKSWDTARYFQATELGLKGEGRNLTGGKLPWCRWLAAEGGDEDQPDGQIAREGIRLLEEKAGKPFFIALGFHKPHDPFIAPKKYFELYPLDQLKLLDREATGTNVPLAVPGGWKNQFSNFTDQERREYMRSYYAGISFMDAQVGKVLDAFDRLKLWDNTVVVFFGDHGFHLGERGWWNKSTIFELSARAPLIVWSPRLKAGAKSSPRLVEFVDIYPTVIELCALQAPSGLEGRSFVPLLEDPTRAWKQAAFTQVQHGQFAGYSVRTERWRYTEWDGGRKGVELYDHESDPGEWHNLSGELRHDATVKELSVVLRKQFANP